jgi:peptide/nickel transport system substrate-binding protein
VIQGAQEGYGTPIGSHMVPSDAGYVDLTAMNAYDPEKAKALLKEAGVATPLNVTLTLPPPQYARKGRRDRRGAAREDRRQREDRERRMGAVAVGPVQRQLRPDHHQPRRAARLHHRLCRLELLHRLPVEGFQRADRRLQLDHRCEGPQQAARRHPAAARDRLARRLHVPASQFAVGNKRLKGLWSSSPVAANDLAALSWQ